MIIVWRGLGFLVPVFVVLSLLVTSRFPQHQSLAGGLALLASAAILWPIGHKLNREQKVHTLFWIPMQYWAIVLAVFAPLVIFGNR